MMNLKLKYCFTFLVLFCNVLAFAQFNTLTRTSIKKEEGFPAKEQIQTVENGKVHKDNERKKNHRINFSNGTTKTDLKREIDSLKIIMLKYALTNSKEKFEKYDSQRLEIEKWKLKKFKDSLIEVINGSKGSSNQNVSNPTSKIAMPLKNRITVTSPFGGRIHPIFGRSKMHNGADLKARYENVYSILDGIVSASGWDRNGGGNYIKIRNSNAFTTSYLHLSQIYYKVGEYVKAGFIIAKSGNSGNSTGPHLHFSVTQNGKYIDPIRFLKDLIKTTI